MKNHFSQHLNIEQMLREARPRHVLELGSLWGENTRNLYSLMPELGFALTVISDDIPTSQGPRPGVTFLHGVSYNEIPRLPDKGIDFVLVDTDHNYWTLGRELIALDAKLAPGALVIVHDVDTFYYDSGVANGYQDGTPYPTELIQAHVGDGGLGACLLDFLVAYKYAYRLVRWLPEGEGIAVIRRNPPDLAATVHQVVEGSPE